jgi:two-component system, NtrC family, sensor kinase
MQRRGESGHQVKGRRTIRPKSRKAPTADSSADHSPEQFDRLKRERDEACQQQAATGEILRVIRASPTDVQPVFETIVRSAVSLCGSLYANAFRFDGELLHFIATHNMGPDEKIARKKYPMRPDSSQVSGRVILTKSIVRVEDALTDPDYDQRYAQAMGLRRILGVPMLRDGHPIGVIVVGWAEPGPVPKFQEELLKTFADQAVIAIENVRLFNETKEALERQTATSDVLKVISRSTFDLQKVLNTLTESAARLCEADMAAITRPVGDHFEHVASYRHSSEHREYMINRPIAAGRGSVTGRTFLEGRAVHILDLQADPDYALETFGSRTALGVPLMRQGAVIGVIVLLRSTVRAFTDRQIELAETFADQAVIAIENVRLFDEVQSHTRELSESLEQQTATSEVLKVISSSPGELQPVFDTMLAKATELCEASYGAMWLCEGDAFRNAAIHGALPAAYIEHLRSGTVYRPLPGRPLARIADTRQPIQIADLRADPSYLEGDTLPVAAVEIAGIRTLLGVPMFKESELVGAIAIYRREVRPFTDKQIEVVSNFGAQAVIAIENTRLLNELRESLQQQTATSDVLKVISRSTFDLQTVLDTLTESAARLCGADISNIWLPSGAAFRLAASYQAIESKQKDYLRNMPLGPSRGSCVGRTLLEARIVHIHDIRDDPEYELEISKLEGYRTMLGVPLLREGPPIGVIALARSIRQPFTPQQIELVNTFADQAVIAIENTRLLNELRESLQQQTATADVLKVISRSTFDLGTVLQTLVESAARLCDADKTNITRQKDGVFFRAEAYGFSPEFMDYVRNIPIQLDRGSAFGRALLERRAVHIPDVKADPEYTLVEGQKLGDYRTVLAVPMLREGVVIGVLSLTRSEVRPFSEKQIELATTFADQAAIAIENVRLFESVEARTRELAQSLDDLRTTQDRLVQTQKLASLGQLTAGIAHEIKNPLNFVNNFSGLSAELVDELQEAMQDLNPNEKIRGEITELMDTLRSNLDKVVQHGKRADAIVKNMLQHSREGSGEHRPVDINTLVEESLNLAYHGARAEKQGFNITLEKSLDPAAAMADLFPQEITRALLNLISNGFYAATKRKAESNGGDYVPTLTAATKNLGDSVEIRIRDNGTGIPPEVREKIFNPFFTTKPAGEGTGLGLSISHDIIVKQHGGSIEVDTKPGEFTEIRVILPRVAALLPERT